MLGHRVTPRTAWNKEAPYGRCPACGAEGIVVKAASTKTLVGFMCSDEGCFTKYQNLPPYWGQIYHTHWHEVRGKDGDAYSGSVEDSKEPR